jgi:NADH-quinone oxidoreductase subunit N
VVTVLSTKGGDADTIEAYGGLLRRRPWLAAVFALMLLSLAGIPVTAGFIGKFYVVAAGVHSALWLLVIMLVFNSVVGLFYYLRIIVTMTATPETRPEHAAPTTLALAGSLTLAALTFLLLWIGTYPEPLIRVIRTLLAVMPAGLA